MSSHKRYLKGGMLDVHIYLTNNQLAYLQDKASKIEDGSVSKVIRRSLNAAMLREGWGKSAGNGPSDERTLVDVDTA